ncbi:YihY/virulence factor BrkB family protein [Humibacter sp.]|uniref:YihY/virulence factor BrkB family protein n=1 Tax=Humibacter sp. TaxID=1940291 RepID=UPI003F81EE4A
MTDDIGSSERLEDAPAPDDPRKPKTPPRLHKPSWTYALRRAMREFVFDQCIDSAGALTYFGVLALFPGLLAVFSILGVVGEGSKATSTVLSLVKQVVPGSTAEVIKGPLEQFARSPVAGVALVTGIVLAIWTASGYVGAFARAMNRIYEIDEGRPYWKKKPAQLLVTLILIVLVIVMILTLVISGPVTDAVGNALGIGPAIKITWSIVKWPILAAAVIVAIAILYYATPNVRQPKFRWTTVGGAFAFSLIVIASVGFGFYVANFSHYNKSYGSLAGIIIFLIWLWIANNLLLLGAEFDSELERGRELQAGIKAEEQIQLPPRDVEQSEKNAEKEEKEVGSGRSLRKSRGRDRSRGEDD